MIKKLVLVMLLISNVCFADDMFFDFGLGVGPSALNSMVETKTLDIGYRNYIWDEFYWQNKLGYWKDNSGDPTRSSSLYGSSILGMEVNLHPVEFRGGAGLALITNTDSYLGGYFPQFNEQFGIGLRDVIGNGISLNYSHISSADIYNPNVGRDFITVEFSTRW
jgi:hypothetical protein